MISARWFPPGSARLLIRRGQAARPLSALAQHPLAFAPGGKREEARLSGGGERAGRSRSRSLSLWGTYHDDSEAAQALPSPGGGAAQL